MRHMSSLFGSRIALARTGATVNILFGLISLAGWALGINELTGVIAGAVTMKVNTALSLTCGGLALLLLIGDTSRHARASARCLGFTVAMLGAATLVEYVAGVDLRIDELFMRDTGTAYNVFRGRPSPFSATAFVALGASLTVLRLQRCGGVARFGAAVGVGVGAISLLGYFWNAGEIITDSWLPPVALNTALSFTLLGGGILLEAGRTGAGDLLIADYAPVEIKVIAGFVLAFGLLLVGGSYTYRTNARFANSMAWVAHTQEVRGAVASVYGSLAGAEISMRDYLLDKDEAQLNGYQRLIGDVRGSLRHLDLLTADNPLQRRNLAVLRPMVEARLAAMADTMTAFNDFGLHAARAVIAVARTSTAKADIGAQTARMDAEEVRLLTLRQAQTANIRATTLISLLVTLAVASALFIVLFRGIHREMRARREAEDALRASDRYNRGIIDSSPDCFAVLTLAGRVTQMTPQGLRLIEVDDFAALANVDWLAFWKGSDLDAARRALHAGVAGSASRFQGSFTTVKGTSKWWDVIVMPIIGADGRPERLLAVARDISDVKRTEHELIESNREAKRTELAIQELNGELRAKATQLETINKELESFSYSVSHDLRAPLRAIDGFALMMEEDYNDRLDTEGRRYLAVIREQSRRMGGLIDDLLAFSRLGRTPMVAHEVNVEALVREVVVEALIGHERAAPQIDIERLPAARGDRSLLRQVWMNLICNAIKYTSKTAQPRIRVTGRQDGAENLYSVQDNGVGFNMQYVDKLFGVFQRLHRADEFSGTGVGLAIVHRVVTRHGGRVWAEGMLNQGAVFSFALPREEQHG